MTSICSTGYRIKNFLIILAFMLGSCGNNNADAQRTAAVDLDPASADKDSIAVTEPPLSLNLDPFYKKYLDASGIPVIGSDKVPDEAFYAIRTILNEMISMRSDILEKMIGNNLRVGIMARTEVTTDLPECRDWNKIFPGTDWNTRGRGYGATVEFPLSSCAEENILCYEGKMDRYHNEDIFIHEFAHSFYGLGIKFIDPNIDEELKQVFDDAISRGLWKDTYAASNMDEYFAEGVQDWYNINGKSIPANGIHNEINTRKELKEYDPGLYNILKRYFKDDNKKISCHER